MEQKSTIIIKRKGQYQGSLSKFKIYIDDRQVGKIKDSETVEYRIAPGRHTVYIKPGFDWTGSRKVALDLEPGQDVELAASFKPSFFVYLTKLQHDDG